MTTYICSDIHGLKDRYDRLIATIQPQDTLYVLGDVIDRGDDGIAILMDIMERKNVIMMMGNHEYMMKQYYEVKKGKITNERDAATYLTRWQNNHCKPTRKAFENLSVEKQDEILDFIDHLPIVIADFMVGDEMFYLVHGEPVVSIEEGTWYTDDLLEKGYMIEDFVWNRVMMPEDYFEDRTVIVGHTPTLYFHPEKPYCIWTGDKDLKHTNLINIDCGCAADDEGTRLALLNLDEREVTYF